MKIESELSTIVDNIVGVGWTERDARVVPTVDTLGLANDAAKLHATVLYADLADSTDLVNRYRPSFAAEIYKSFLRVAGRIIESEDGVITAFDGDRVMAIFLGHDRTARAARTGLKINWAVRHVIRPRFQAVYPTTNYVLNHVVGIDDSELYVVKGGPRGANDLIWVGRAANYAAKLAAKDHAFQVWLTLAAFVRLPAKLLTDNVGGYVWAIDPPNSFPDHFVWKSSHELALESKVA